MITLSDGNTTLELPYDLDWSDRHWAPVEQSMTRGITGKPLIQEAVRQLGRPITLAPPQQGGGWWPMREEAQVKVWLSTPNQTLTLTIRGAAHTVRFRHFDGDAYVSQPLCDYSDPRPEDYVIPTFRFITVEP